MSKHKRGKVLRSDERALVYNVIKYFDGEKDAKKYQPHGKSDERASMATGLPLTVISRIKNEGPLIQQSTSKDTTKTKDEERTRRTPLNHTKLCAFREIIERIYEDMEIPTVGKILANARRDFNFEGSRARVRGILRNQLGFKFNTQYPNNNLVLERNSIKIWRLNYLRYIQENNALKDNKKPLVYVGELVINVPAENAVSKRPIQRWMIFHAGCENGFINGAEVYYSYKANKERPKASDFVKYIEETLIPKLPKDCIVVMNNSSRHNMQLDHIPTLWSTKDQMKKWMVDHYIPFEEDWVKAQLLLAIKKTRPIKKYAVDEVLAKHGHTVKRLPPFHTDLNALEYIWMKVESRVVRENLKVDTICDLIKKAIESITVEDWKEAISQVKKFEERYWLRDVLKEDDFDDLTCKVGLQSDSDSDSDTEYDYKWSSSSSEESDEDTGSDWTDID